MKPMERDFVSGQLEDAREWREQVVIDDLDSGVWLQSGISGLWHQDYKAPGPVVEVRINGVRFVPACLDAQDDETV